MRGEKSGESEICYVKRLVMMGLGQARVSETPGEKFQFLLFTKLSSIEERIKRFRAFFHPDNTELNDYEVIIGSSWLHLDVGLSFCGTIIIS